MDQIGGDGWGQRRGRYIIHMCKTINKKIKDVHFLNRRSRNLWMFQLELAHTHPILKVFTVNNYFFS